MDIVDEDGGDGVWVKLTIECRYTLYGFCRSGHDCLKSAVSFVVKYNQLVLSYIKWSRHNYFWNMLLFNTNFVLNQDLLFLCVVVFHIDWCS